MESEICYLCGQPRADTREHVVPRNLYLPPLPNDVLTLPAHRACNQSTSKDEESVMLALNLSLPGRGVLGDPRAEKALRALLRPQAAGLRADFESRMVSLGPAGGTIGIPEGRMTRVLAKIAKGIMFAYDGRLVSQENAWWCYSVESEDFMDDSLSKISSHHDVLVTRWTSLESEPNFTVWLMSFFGTRFYSIITGATDSWFARSEYATDGMVLSWPLAPSGSDR